MTLIHMLRVLILQDASTKLQTAQKLLAKSNSHIFPTFGMHFQKESHPQAMHIKCMQIVHIAAIDTSLVFALLL